MSTPVPALSGVTVHVDAERFPANVNSKVVCPGSVTVSVVVFVAEL